MPLRSTDGKSRSLNGDSDTSRQKEDSTGESDTTDPLRPKDPVNFLFWDWVVRRSPSNPAFLVVRGFSRVSQGLACVDEAGPMTP